MDLHRFTHPKVRDLAWALGSASLIQHQEEIPMLSSEWWHQEFVFAQDWLRDLDKEPSDLLSYLDPNRGKQLGLLLKTCCVVGWIGTPSTHVWHRIWLFMTIKEQWAHLTF